MELLGVSPDHEAMTVTPAGFRRALGCFATGVTVITVDNREQVHGMTANAFTAVSLEPPLVLVCIDRRNRTHQCLQAMARFGISLLSEAQKSISEYYALPALARSQNSYTTAHFFRTNNGTPVLDGSLAFLECRVREMHPAGDHTVFVAQVENLIAGEGRPLLYFRGNYRSIATIEER
jgi:flavin reductase